MVHICVSLPSNKIDEIWDLAYSLLQRYSVTVCQVMFFLVRANFCASGHSQLQQWSHIIQSDMLHVFHSPAYFYFFLLFSGLALCQLRYLCQLQQNPVPL